MRNRHLQLDAVAVHGSRRNITQANGLTCIFAFLYADFPAVEADLLLIAAEQLCAERTDFAAQLERALLGRLAGDIDRTRGIRAGIIRRPVGVRTQRGDVVKRTLKHLCRDLRKRGITAGAHVSRADEQRVKALIVDLERRTADVHARDARALHRHAHADRTNLAVSHVPARILVIPVDHVVHARQTAVERTACVQLTVVRGHDLTLVRNIHLTDFERVHAEDIRQLVYRALDREQALRCAVAAVRARRHVIGVHNVTRKAERLGLAVQRNRLMTGQTDRCRAVLTVRAGVGQRVQVDAAHDAVLVCAQTDVHFHLVARRRCNLALHAAEDDLGRLFRHPGDKRRIHRADRGLLGAEAAADARLGDAHLAFRDMQCVRHDSAGVEHDLR